MPKGDIRRDHLVKFLTWPRAGGFVCRRKLDAKAQPAFLAKTRCDLFADELQRAHDFFIAEETPAIELSEDAIETELAGQILEAHRYRCWSSDNHFIAQRIFIADGL